MFDGNSIKNSTCADSGICRVSKERGESNLAEEREIQVKSGNATFTIKSAYFNTTETTATLNNSNIVIGTGDNTTIIGTVTKNQHSANNVLTAVYLKSDLFTDTSTLDSNVILATLTDTYKSDQTFYALDEYSGTDTAFLSTYSEGTNTLTTINTSGNYEYALRKELPKYLTI